MTRTPDQFSEGCAEIRAALVAFSAINADRSYRPGGWTRKEVLGHMLDSAANNHQRFVRAALEGRYVGPGYQQNSWVAIHGYADMPWEMLLERWVITHRMLEQVVARIPDDRLESMCLVGDDAPMTLQFLIEDYVAHQRHHLAQILS